MASNEELLELYGSVRRKLSVKMNGILKDLGVGTRQFIILKSISREVELKITELAEMCMTDLGSISRSVDQLKKAGLVEKFQSESDGRVWLVRLTKKGQSQMPRIHKVYSEISRVCFSKLSSMQKENLGLLLQQVVANLET